VLDLDPEDASACAAGELAGRIRAAVHHPGDLVERHREHVVQHERESFRRRERVEHDLQRGAERVGEHCLVLGVAAGVGSVDDFVERRVARRGPA
jgi:hypothetical protein